jgi:hypothetical protein
MFKEYKTEIRFELIGKRRLCCGWHSICPQVAPGESGCCTEMLVEKNVSEYLWDLTAMAKALGRPHAEIDEVHEVEMTYLRLKAETAIEELSFSMANVQLRMLDAMEIRDASLLSKGQTRLAKRAQVSLVVFFEVEGFLIKRFQQHKTLGAKRTLTGILTGIFCFSGSPRTRRRLQRSSW